MTKRIVRSRLLLAELGKGQNRGKASNMKRMTLGTGAVAKNMWAT